MRFVVLFLLSVFVVCPLLVFAEEQQGDSKPLAIPDFSKVSNAPSGTKVISVETTCKTADGRMLKKNEAGYDSCVSASQRELSNRMKSSSSSSSGPATGVNFKFGK